MIWKMFKATGHQPPKLRTWSVSAIGYPPALITAHNIGVNSGCLLFWEFNKVKYAYGAGHWITVKEVTK